MGGRRAQGSLRAAETARIAGDASAFARAALGHAGGTWDQFGVMDVESVALLEEALRLLPVDDSPIRAQVMARLSVQPPLRRAGARRPSCRRPPTRRSRWYAGSAAAGLRTRPSRLAGRRAARPLAARPRGGAAELSAELIQVTEAHGRLRVRRRRAHLARGRAARAVPAR